MSCAGNRNRSLSMALLALGLAAALVAACSGPTNPEPILMEPRAITLTDQQGSVTVQGTLGAIENADAVQIVDLQQQTAVTVSLNPDGSFSGTLTGLATDSFRITARRLTDGATAVLHVTGDPNGSTAPQVIDRLGCLSVTPTDLDLGSGPAGEPLYGELTVTNDCVEAVQFMQVASSSSHFTAVSLLGELPVEPGASATVSITFMGPGGAEEAIIYLEPIPVSDPTQVPLLITVRANALP